MTFDERIAKQIKETLKSLDHAEYWLNHHIGNYIRIQRNGVEYIEELLRRQKDIEKNLECTCHMDNENYTDKGTYPI